MPDWRAYVRERLPLGGVRPDLEPDVVDDLAAQLDDAYREHLARGLSESEAEAAALAHVDDWPELARQIAASRRLNQLTQQHVLGKESPMNILGWIGRDLHYAVRSLLKDRRSVALAVAALALGIGATTVIFSVVYSVFVNTFPFEDPNRVVHFYIQAPNQPGRSAWYPAPEFDVYRSQNDVFTQVLGGASLEVLYDIEGSTYRVRGAHIDPRALSTLGVRPLLGRGMTDADGAPEAPPTFLMSDRMWGEQFDRSPDVIGKTITLNGTPRTLIAILPPRFLLHGADVFFPTTFTSELTNALIGGPGNAPLMVWTYGRLKPGVSMEQAAANLQVIGRNLAGQYPNRYPEQFNIAVMPLADAYTGQNIKEMVYILAGAVLMLLMISCSNVANLLLARATARETEMALRASLGASRLRLMQQLLTESFVLAAAGTALGGFLSYVGLQWVKAAIPTSALPAEMAIRFSTDALLATVGVTVLTTFLCGLVPALRASRGDLRGRLTGSGKGAGLQPARGRLRTVLVAVQVTLAVVLLVGAGLMMRTFFALQQIDPGLDPTNVLVGRFAFPQNQPMTPAQRNLFLQQVTQRVSALPDVVAASPAFGVPLQPGPNMPVFVTGTPPGDSWRSAMEFVGDGYFRAVGLPLVRGRLFSATDVEAARPVVVVNRKFVEAYLEDDEPIGRTITFSIFGPDPAQRPLLEIVGVVGDARNSGLQQDVSPQAFLPYTMPGFAALTIVVRTSLDPLSMQQEVRQQIWSVDRGVALMNVTSLEDTLHRDALAAPTFAVGLMSTFAVVGLILSAIGVFSVMAYTVSLQTREIGIRIALGAEPGGVVRAILLKGLRPIVAGVLIGAGAAYALSRVMASQIYGVTATDPWTFGAVVLVLMGVGMAACLLPARRATKVDPLIALRTE